MVQLLAGLRDRTNVCVVDAYGKRGKYVDDITSLGIPLIVLESHDKANPIGGRGALGRAYRLAVSLPGMLRLAARLRRVIADVRPRAMWTTSEKALFVAARAARGRVPIGFFLRGEMRRMRWYCRRGWKQCGLLMSNSARALDLLQPRRWIPSRTAVIYTGIDVEALDAASRRLDAPLPCMESPLKLVLPAALIPLKNHPLALRGLARFVERGGQATLWVCGGKTMADNSGYMAFVHDQIRTLGLGDRVHLLGYRHDMPAVMARADVVVLTSDTEGLPRAILEGMALGKPVLATDVGGIGELVRDGMDGCLFARRDVEGFARGLQTLVSPATRRTMGDSGRERVRHEFTPDAQAERFLEAMRQIERASDGHQG